MMIWRQNEIETAFNPELVREPIVLASPTRRDFEEWATLREQSRAHLTAWEQDWAEVDVTRAAFQRRLNLWRRERRQRVGLQLFARRSPDGQLIGVVTLSQIRYGATCAGSLGYWVGAPFARKGYGALMVGEICRHAFTRMKLNRVVAACQPDNEASWRLLAKIGFCKEGRAKDYLRINGAWRDHDIYALLAKDFLSDRDE